MTQIETEEYDELAEIQRLVGRQRESPTVHGFHTAALFLLDLNWINLFEPVSAAPGAMPEFRCKGCGNIVPMSKREKHHAQHRRAFLAGRYSAPGGAPMADDAKKTKKPTAKDQGFPDAYLAPNGNFKPGLDARAKSDLIAAVLDLDQSKALVKFEKAEAARLIKARGWDTFVEKKRQTLAAAEERKARQAEKAAEAAKEKAAAKASTKTDDKPGDVKPDPKPTGKSKTGRKAA